MDETKSQFMELWHDCYFAGTISIREAVNGLNIQKQRLEKEMEKVDHNILEFQKNCVHDYTHQGICRKCDSDAFIDNYAGLKKQ